MSIPDFQTIMLPFLELASDGKEHKLSDEIEHLATYFNLTSNERKEMLSSGKQARFNNYVRWACTHLRKAGLLSTPSRGKFQITSRGLDTLAQKPSRIDVKYLRQFPEHSEFVGWTTPNLTNAESNPALDFTVNLEQTPDEVMELAFQELRSSLAMELLERIKRCSPASKFTEQAKSYLPANVKVVLIDGQQLAEYAIEVNLGVSVVSEYQIKRLNFDYFDGE